MMRRKLSVNIQHVKIGLVFTVFFLFFSSAIGLLEFNLISGLRISVNSQVADNILILSYRISSLDTVLFIIIGILLSVLLPILGPVRGSLLVLGSIILLYLFGQLAITGFSIIPFEYFMLMILMLYVVNILISYFIEIHSKQQILDTFGQYLPPHIVSKISAGESKLTLEGEAKNLTVMFCDIQSFTRIAEELNPKQLAKLLNEYFTSLSGILFKHNATLDKFIGDSIMAFWGAPLKQDDQAEKSVLCAMEMIEEISQLSERFKRRGWPGPSAGIGINSGLMAVGNMGSTYRMAYTVIGDAVNVASRIESLTRSYRVPVIISESTRQQCRGILFRELDNVILKGKRRPVRLYQPVCPQDKAGPELLEQLDKHAVALEAFYKKDFERAGGLFRELAAEFKQDQYYAMMAEKMDLLKTETIE